MTKSPFNNPRKLVCIHCQYERAYNDGIKVCPECGKQGLAYEYQIVPRLRRLKKYVWGEFFMVIFLATSVTGTIIPNPFSSSEFLFLPIIFIIATIQGIAGIFIICSMAERGGSHAKSLHRKYTWAGMMLSILLIASIPIIIFEAIFLS